MTSRTPLWSAALATALVSLALPVAGCSKKKSASTPDTTPAGTVAGVGGTSTTTTTTGTKTDVSVDTAVVADASALVIPSSINLIPPKSEEGAALRLTASDFENDPTNVHLKEDMFTPVDKAVAILCFVSQTRGMEFVNQGAYRAYVDGAKCGMESGNSTQGSVSYDDVTVRATQDGTHPPRIEMWLASGDKNSSGDGQIYAQLDMAEGPSDSNPLGVLKMRWSEGDAGGGYIETRKFADPDGDGRDRAELLFNTVEGSGQNSSTKKAFASVYVTAGAAPTDGYVSTSTDSNDNYNGQAHHTTTDYKAAFNADYVARSGSTSEDGTARDANACKDRNGFINFVDRYNLYSLAGDRVELNSGKPGECMVDGAKVQANFSYYGIWNQANVAASALSECKFVDWSSGTRAETPVDVVSAPGRLVKYTRAQTTLSALTGLELQAYGNGGGNGHDIIKWTGDATGFQKIATESCDQSGCQRTAASGAVTANNPWDGSLNFYAPTLDANMNVHLDAVSDTYVIYYFNRATASGTADVPSGDLVCYDNCPKMTPTAEELTAMMGPSMTVSPYHTTTVTYGGQSMTVSSPQNLAGAPMGTYTFDPASLLLKEGDVGFTLPNGLSSNSNANVMSGPLVPSADFAALTTDQKTHANGHDLERLFSTFYRWEAGSNQWSQFAGVKVGGAFVAFDKPVELSYTFAQADNMNATFGAEFYGAPVRLSYGGVGNLWGIPSGQGEDHFAKFSLKSGTEIGAYKVKAVEIAQTMSDVDTATCDTLQTSRAPNLDSLPAVVNPTVETKPTGDLSLKVIGGELVTAP